ncbi:MAG: hypothetical protein H0U13_05370, partial [Gemmatimonadaceae bacterium]|nr:hypothetical protein [Gemmatimonadaceae bacterium]
VSRTVEFDSFVVERCTITMKKPIARVARDGEIETMSTPLEYRIERDMLHVVVAAAGGESSDAPAPS